MSIVQLKLKDQVEIISSKGHIIEWVVAYRSSKDGLAIISKQIEQQHYYYFWQLNAAEFHKFTVAFWDIW